MDSKTQIYDTNDEFDFKTLHLTKPAIMSGGNYFIKYLVRDTPLYIQTPKCTIKEGIIQSGKRWYCDLMFTNENERFIEWIETLESHSQKFIYDNRAKWFETELELHDIENCFTSPLKLFKSGKYYILRTTVPSILGKCQLKIYDENENEINNESLKENETGMVILEMKGIKCSARSFQMDVEIKQMMILKPQILFDKCILTRKPKTEQIVSSVDLDLEKDLAKEPESKPLVTENHDEQSNNEVVLEDEPIVAETKIKKEEEKEEEDNNELQEIDFSLEEIPEENTLQLKKRNDVYYEMYRDAIKKARIAKELAISSYLEAKRIKQTYMLKDIDDSDLEQEETFSKMSNL